MKRTRNKRQKDAYRKLKLIAQFIIAFNLLSLPMYIVLYFDAAWVGLQDFVAAASSAILRAIGYDNVLAGHEIRIEQQDSTRVIDVSWDSSGWKSVYAMFSLVMATPLVTLRKKISCLLILLPSVFAVNILRIVTTIAVSVTYGFSNFDFVHLFLWRYLLIGTILALWALFLKKEKIIGRKHKI